MYNNRHNNLTYGADGSFNLNMDLNWGDSIINNNELFTMNSLSSRRRNDMNNYNSSSLEHFEENSANHPESKNPVSNFFEKVKNMNTNTTTGTNDNKTNTGSNDFKCENDKFDGIQAFKCGPDSDKIFAKTFKTEKEAAEACEKDALCRGYVKYEYMNDKKKNTEWIHLIDVADGDCTAYEKAFIEGTKRQPPIKGFCKKK